MTYKDSVARGAKVRWSRLLLLGSCLGAYVIARIFLPAIAATGSDWPTFGNDPGHSHFTSLSEITPQNVSGLRPVWAYSMGGAGGRNSVTPIVVNGVMYIALAKGAAALEPESGKEIWKFVPEVETGGRQMRGVSYWRGDATHAPMVIVGANDRFYGVDAKTGKPVPTFGENGSINLRVGVADKYPENYYSVSSPPAIYQDLMITGPAIQEFGSEGPSGDPRAFDLRTGKLEWRFHIVPQPGTPGGDSWGPKGTENRAGPSAWGLITIDESTGTAFLPTGNPSDSYNGVDRPGDNLFANSVLALDAATGKLKWYYQIVHHDVNDYDVSAAPSLIEVVHDGVHIPAVAEATKHGMLFILDRRTGKPIYGVEERPVPQSDVPGEKTSATQPFTLKPPPLARMNMTRNDISNVSPESNRFCRDIWDRNLVRAAVPFGPASIYGVTAFIPGTGGGSNWGGISFNPELGYVFVNVTNEPVMSKMAFDGKGGYKLEGAYTRINDQNGYPCVEPPWGVLYAINANTGDIAWQKPLGNADIYGERGKTTGTPNNGGSLATASGLLFIGATRDGRFRAFDARNGTELWSAQLPSQAQATPMTFLGKDGHQFIVICSGGLMVAFGLPRDGYPPVTLPAPTAARGGRGRGGAGPNNGPSFRPPDPANVFAPVAPSGTAPAAITADNLPDGPGKQDFLNMCSGCHGIQAALALRQPRAAWVALIEDMRGRGARGTDEMANRVADYLAAHFGPAR